MNNYNGVSLIDDGMLHYEELCELEQIISKLIAHGRAKEADVLVEKYEGFIKAQCFMIDRTLNEI